MKALLSQWIGTGTTKPGQLSSQHSGSTEKIQGSGDTEQQPFLGFMMGFLGMGAKVQTPEKTSDSLTGEASSKTAGQQLVQNDGSQSGSQQLAGDMMTTEAKIESKKIPTAGKEQTRTEAAGNSSQKVQTEDAPKNLDAGSVVINNQAAIAGEMPNKNMNTVQGSVTTPVDGKNSPQATAETVPKTSAQIDSKSVLNNQSKVGDSASLMNDKGETAGVEQNPGTKGLKLQATSAKNEALVNQPESEGSKKSVLNNSGAHTQLKEMNQTPAAKDNSKSIVEGLKKIQKQGATENGKSAERASIKSAKSGRPADHQTMSWSAQNSTVSSAKVDLNVEKAMPGKFTFSQSANPAQVEMDMDMPQEFKGGAENASKEIQINELKSAHFGEAAGRKSFSRQLAQASRPQVSQQSESSSQETAQWKHHRFMLEDGKSIHVAARNIEGALQLQLNAGKGELGKMLHQHLQDIQQHVQEELNIKIDLQLQDFSGGQSNQQATTSSGGEQVLPQHGSATGSSTMDMTQSNGTQNVRYFGFNSNEWTA